ncbi:MAG: OmpA family protein [Flavobacteriales bacterium]|nr:OmpA family protein [Flavobacteriia bacterium]NCP07086.1 OmpA family protein [Flavobacteriales bacterium]PIV93011.1 MAG: cell envelope biogenesis protein OmpA [Flavobacteriaceae bacterium CG17_big_fil_post_rev_8_21_14_2_50_33_15]PIY09793.1 MAG: cell envelope biogenesis protein OmpA [Flavobacteriaceae bacterium CG_4_10_14_3_um_filter_33_47]PJB18668.1 MAG: cell envelope biogenesis protein OmpA [Flavobacteriaceae bacterium CG_4_9_14_3_um_filter_33_16]
MIKKISLAVITLALIASCVSPKVYKELEGKYSNLKQENRKLSEENESLLNAKTIAENELKQLQSAYDEAVAERDRLQSDYNATKANYDALKASYDALEKNSSEAIAANSQKNRELLAQLEAKEQALASENQRLEKLKRELEDRSNRVAELEKVIADKDAAMTALKDAISRALTDFEGKGLTVEQRDGKVYVSMENKLLFSSGSWAVGTEGRRAVQQLGSVLGQNPDIAVLIEGHTDNVPYQGNAQLSGNWDLSTKRATAIVNILRENATINPENLTAAGRGEYAPVATNSTPEGKAKNRRIEVILTPKLDELSKLLNDN